MVSVVMGEENAFADYVKKTNRNIYAWGSGVMFQICLRYILLEYDLVNRVIGCTESDLNKIGKLIRLGDNVIPILSYEEMVNKVVLDDKAIIVVACSYYKEILNKLDNEPRVANVQCVLLPMLYIENKKIFNRNISDGTKKIPKIIHYCWFGGGTIPEQNVRCIESWGKMCPDYIIMRWDESNINIEMSPWIKKAYKEKKWAFVSDYIRAWALYKYGGYYFDVDVELINTLEDLASMEAFVCFEKWPVINTGGGCGSIQGFWYWKECMEIRDYYVVSDTKAVIPTASGFYDTIPIIRRGLRTDGSFQEIDGLVCLPSEYFHPFDYVSGRTEITSKTCGIHYFNWSWANNCMENGKINEDYYSRLLERSHVFF